MLTLNIRLNLSQQHGGYKQETQQFSDLYLDAMFFLILNPV